MRLAFLALLAGLGTVADAAPDVPPEACFVRQEPSPAVASATVEPRASQSHLGWRQKATRLYEVELVVVGQGLAVCSVTGTARLRDGPDGKVLVLPVRPGARVASNVSPCLVSIHIAPTTAAVAITEASCQAQALCGGRVQLQGQQFELAARVQPDAKGPCFASPGL